MGSLNVFEGIKVSICVNFKVKSHSWTIITHLVTRKTPHTILNWWIRGSLIELNFVFVNQDIDNEMLFTTDENEWILIMSYHSFLKQLLLCSIENIRFQQIGRGWSLYFILSPIFFQLNQRNVLNKNKN